jgi:hypothetical protein
MHKMAKPESSLESTFEFLVVGILVSLIIAIDIWSTLPVQTTQFASQVHFPSAPNWAIAALASLITAIAYSVGVIAEDLARASFEWRLNAIKENRLLAFQDQIADQVDASASTRVKYLSTSHGLMRFAIIKSNSRLSVEITEQVSRLRLIRTLFLVLLGALYSIALWLIRDSNPLLIPGLILTLIALAAVAIEVENRFTRYCRAIERSFSLLVLTEVFKHPDISPNEAD